MGATARIDIGRGTGENLLGDEVGLDLPPLDGEPVPGVEYAEVLTPAGGIPASLIEKRTTSFDASTGTARVVRYVSARFTDRVGVQVGDVVRDRRTGRSFPVDEVVVVTRLSGARSVRCGLRGTLSE